MPDTATLGRMENGRWEIVTDDATPARLPDFEQWREAGGGPAVELQTGDSPESLADALQELSLVAVRFPALTDGRGFSCARALREMGFAGEIRAVGGFIRDQIPYMVRCGFDAFAPEDKRHLPASLDEVPGFSEHYQGSAIDPRPLFRRRHD